jgi:hypothetical protein
MNMLPSTIRLCRHQAAAQEQQSTRRRPGSMQYSRVLSTCNGCRVFFCQLPMARAVPCIRSIIMCHRLRVELQHCSRCKHDTPPELVSRHQGMPHTRVRARCCVPANRQLSAANESMAWWARQLLPRLRQEAPQPAHTLCGKLLSACMSSAASCQSATARLAAMRPGFVDFGRTLQPRSSAQRIKTCGTTTRAWGVV